GLVAGDRAPVARNEVDRAHDARGTRAPPGLAPPATGRAHRRVEPAAREVGDDRESASVDLPRGDVAARAYVERDAWIGERGALELRPGAHERGARGRADESTFRPGARRA